MCGPGFLLSAQRDFETIQILGAIVSWHELTLFDYPVDLPLCPPLLVVRVLYDGFALVFDRIV